MTSKMMIEDVNLMKAEGLEPTPEDIVRLNVLALKYEEAKAKHSTTSIYTLPRVAIVNDGMYFRQPTVGHEIWFEKVKEVVDLTDYGTTLAVNAYALSRDHSELVDPYSQKSVKEAITAFTERLKDYTTDQLFYAIDYVKNGIDQSKFEYAAKRQTEEKDDQPDWTQCVALGVLNEGRAVLWGLSERDLMGMTTRQLNDTIRSAYIFHDVLVNESADSLLGDYNITLDTITDRLRKEKNG